MAKVKYFPLLTYCRLQYLFCVIFIIVFDFATSSVISLRWRRHKLLHSLSSIHTVCFILTKVKYYALLTYCRLQYLFCVIFIIVLEFATSSVISLRWKRFSLNTVYQVNVISVFNWYVSNIKYYALLRYCWLQCLFCLIFIIVLDFATSSVICMHWRRHKLIQSLSSIRILCFKLTKVKYYALLTYCRLQYLFCVIFIIVLDFATSSVISLRWKRLESSLVWILFIKLTL